MMDKNAINMADELYIEKLHKASVVNDQLMLNNKAYQLFQQGRICEFQYEFNDALDYYYQSIACTVIPMEIYCDLWSNMGFCWLYKKEFKSAEICCCRAIELNPKRWEVWKNLGVSLEHQGCLKESLKAFTQAVDLSNGNEIGILNLLRFDRRHGG